MNDIIGIIGNFLNFARGIFNEGILPFAGNFFRAIINLLIAALAFIIDVLRWIVGN